MKKTACAFPILLLLLLTGAERTPAAAAEAGKPPEATSKNIKTSTATIKTLNSTKKPKAPVSKALPNQPSAAAGEEEIARGSIPDIPDPEENPKTDPAQPAKTQAQKDAEAASAKKLGKAKAVVDNTLKVVDTYNAVNEAAEKVVNESDNSDSTGKLIGKTAAIVVGGIIADEVKDKLGTVIKVGTIAKEEYDAAQEFNKNPNMSAGDKAARAALAVGATTGRVAYEAGKEAVTTVTDPLWNTGVAVGEGVNAAKAIKDQYKAEQNLEDFKNREAGAGGLSGEEALKRAERRDQLNAGNDDVKLLKLSGDLSGRTDAYKTDALPASDSDRLGLVKGISGSAKEQADEIQKLLDKENLTQAEYAEVQKKLAALGKQVAETKTELNTGVGNKGLGASEKSLANYSLVDVRSQIQSLEKKAENDAYKQRKAASDAEYEAAGKKWEEKQQAKTEGEKAEAAKAAADEAIAERQRLEKEARDEREAEEKENRRKATLPFCDAVSVGTECNERDTPASDDGPAPELKGDCPEGERLEVKWKLVNNVNKAVGAECIKDPNYKPGEPEPGQPEPGNNPKPAPSSPDAPEAWEAEWQNNYNAYHADLDRAAEEKKRAKEERSERCKNADCYELPEFKLDVPEATDSSYAVVFALNPQYAQGLRGVYYGLDERRKTIAAQMGELDLGREAVCDKLAGSPPVLETTYESFLGSSFQIAGRAAVQQHLTTLRQLKSHYNGEKVKVFKLMKIAADLPKKIEAYNASVRSSAAPLKIINGNLDLLLPASKDSHARIQEISAIDYGGLCSNFEQFMEQVDNGILGAEFSLKQDAALQTMAVNSLARMNQIEGAVLTALSDAELLLMARQLDLDARIGGGGSLMKQREALYGQMQGARAVSPETFKQAARSIALADKLRESMSEPLQKEAVRRLNSRLDALSKDIPERLAPGQLQLLAKRHQALNEYDLSSVRGFISGEADNDIKMRFREIAGQMNDAERTRVMGTANAAQSGPGAPGTPRSQPLAMRDTDGTEGQAAAPQQLQMRIADSGGARKGALVAIDMPDSAVEPGAFTDESAALNGTYAIKSKFPAAKKPAQPSQPAAPKAPPAREPGGDEQEEAGNITANAQDDLQEVKSSLAAVSDQQAQEALERAQDIAEKASENLTALGGDHKAQIQALQTRVKEVEDLVKQRQKGRAAATGAPQAAAGDPGLEAARALYQKFAQAYSAKDLAGVLDLLTEDWESSEGITLADMERTLSNSFSVFDSIKMEIQSLQLRPLGDGTYQANYTSLLTGSIRQNDIKREEKSSHVDTVILTSQGAKISKTSGSTAWVK
ncbi:MAG: hypothetical protein Q7R35_09080 [Elusimicrobiota bacterium]|nr:hypothetical protein [Elusimicrobiota bacterium]